MKAALTVLGLICALTVPGIAAAEERIDHYDAREAASLEEAVANFSTYNDRLAGILDKGDLSDSDLESVHELTYTLENALERIREDLDDLAETLEALHVVSEEHDAAATRRHGADYLKAARTVIP